MLEFGLGSVRGGYQALVWAPRARAAGLTTSSAGRFALCDEHADAVRRMLDGALTPRQVDRWMSTISATLDGRSPHQALADGDVDAVLRAAQSWDGTPLGE